MKIAGKTVNVTADKFNPGYLCLRYHKHTYHMQGDMADPLLRSKVAAKLDQIDQERKASREYWTNNADSVLKETI